MKCKTTIVSLMFGILMSCVAMVSNAAGTELGNGIGASTSAASEVSGQSTLSGTAANTAAPKRLLTAEELTSLQTKEAQSPELLKQVAAGCRNVWDPNLNQYVERCYDPVRVGVMGGLLGVIIDVGVGGNGIFGALGGFVLGYFLVS